MAEIAETQVAMAERRSDLPTPRRQRWEEPKIALPMRIGAGVALVFCVSPLLVLVLGGIGLSSWFGWIDSGFHILFAVSVIVGIYSGVRYIRRKRAPATIEHPEGV